MFAELKQFRDQHCHCKVPSNTTLGHWASHQRVLAKKGQLGRNRKSRLTVLGFVWNPFDAQWEAMFAALTNYKKTFGDCDVPRNWSGDRSLANWVAQQRMRGSRRTLSAAHKKRLDAIGFVWDPREDFWEDMFSKLKQYQIAHGDCDIPKLWPSNQKLANWVWNQRKLRNKGKLLETRKMRLDALGFEWSVRERKLPSSER
jgi:hypothetical protein